MFANKQLIIPRGSGSGGQTIPPPGSAFLYYKGFFGLRGGALVERCWIWELEERGLDS